MQVKKKMGKESCWEKGDEKRETHGCIDKVEQQISVYLKKPLERMKSYLEFRAFLEVQVQHPQRSIFGPARLFSTFVKMQRYSEGVS